MLYWRRRTELPLRQLLAWLNILPSKFYHWKKRYQQPNKHNGEIPKKHWLLESEKQAIIDYRKQHPEVGYRYLSYQMLDENIVAVCPSSVYRVLKSANLLASSWRKTSKKGTGFSQPTFPHEHWHIDISYINIAATFYYLCSILDGYSRYIAHSELRETMKEADIEIILQKAKEKFPTATPRIISDNGPQFIANDFKGFIRMMEMTHVKTSPYYPQSNGKLERWHGTIKSECVREHALTSLGQAENIITEYVEYYNQERLHSSIGYVAPVKKLQGLEPIIFKERKAKLADAKLYRQQLFIGRKAPDEMACLTVAG